MSRRRLALPIVVITCAGAFLSACGDDPDVTATTVDDWSTTIEWNDCDTGSQCGTLEVPFDYSNPSLGTFALPVARHLATDSARRIGVLLMNPGGPGGSGVDFALAAENWAGAEIVERFDIVGWDPRGVAGSVPSVDCVDDMYDYFALDPSPDSDDETRLLLDGAARFADECAARSGSILPYVDTVRAASDIDVLRRALGEETVSYFGFSYGTKLGATWISMFPDTVRAAVLDAAIDPTLGYIDDLVLQAEGFETSLNTYFDYCDDARCRFMREGESAREAFDRISLSLDEHQIDNPDGLPPTNQGVLATAAAVSLYSDLGWTGLTEALDAASHSDGLPLLLLFDSYFGISNGVPNDSIDAYFGVTCADRGSGVTESSVSAARTRLIDVAPRLGDGWIQEMLVCANWSGPSAVPVRIGADTAHPTLVVGSTGDAATPLAGTVNMAHTLGDSRLIVTDIEQHTSYGTDGCATRAVDDYLVNLVDGPDVLEC